MRAVAWMPARDWAGSASPGTDVVANLDGLELERAGPVLRPVETPEGERVAIDALVRARRVAGSVV